MEVASEKEHIGDGRSLFCDILLANWARTVLSQPLINASGMENVWTFELAYLQARNQTRKKRNVC
jgi:hypothetical protein